MSLLTRLIAERLVSSVVAELVGQHEGGPAIFTGPQVPEDAPETYVWVLQTMDDRSEDTKLVQGRRIMRTIWCVAKNVGSWEPVETLALRAREAFHRRPLNGSDSALGDVKGVIADVSGPTAIESEDRSVVCLAVTLNFRYVN